MSNSLWPHGLYSPWYSPGQNTGVGSLFLLSLLQGIFPTQESNTGLPHCRWILYQLSHKGSTRILEWVVYPFSSRSSWPRNRTGVSCIAGGFFTNWALREALSLVNYLPFLGVNPLLVTSFANTSVNVWVIFLFLFIVFFVVQKVLSLSNPICLFLFLFSLLQEMCQKRSCCDLCQGVFYVFLWEFYSVWPYICILNPFWVYFCVCC